jgi:hypothetical protein
MTDKDPKKESQLSRADDWLNKAIDPAPQEEPKQEDEQDKKEEQADG